MEDNPTNKISSDTTIEISNLKLPDKIKSKGRTKEKGPLNFQPKKMVDPTLSRDDLHKKLIKPVNKHNHNFYKLNDRVIFYFLQVFKKNTRAFDFVDPLYLTLDSRESFIIGNIYSIIKS